MNTQTEDNHDCRDTTTGGGGQFVGVVFDANHAPRHPAAFDDGDSAPRPENIIALVVICAALAVGMGLGWTLNALIG